MVVPKLNALTHAAPLACISSLPQLTVDKATLEALEAAAKAQGKSLAALANEALQQAAGKQ